MGTPDAVISHVNIKFVKDLLSFLLKKLELFLEPDGQKKNPKDDENTKEFIRRVEKSVITPSCRRERMTLWGVEFPGHFFYPFILKGKVVNVYYPDGHRPTQDEVEVLLTGTKKMVFEKFFCPRFEADNLEEARAQFQKLLEEKNYGPIFREMFSYFDFINQAADFFAEEYENLRKNSLKKDRNPQAREMTEVFLKFSSESRKLQKVLKEVCVSGEKFFKNTGKLTKAFEKAYLVFRKSQRLSKEKKFSKEIRLPIVKTTWFLRKTLQYMDELEKFKSVLLSDLPAQEERRDEVLPPCSCLHHSSVRGYLCREKVGDSYKERGPCFIDGGKEYETSDCPPNNITPNGDWRDARERKEKSLPEIPATNSFSPTNPNLPPS